MSDDDIKEWARKVFERSFPQMRASAVFLSVYSKGMREDPTPCLQLGIALLLDKPIIVLAAEGEAVPENLRKVAKKICTYNLDSPESLQEATRKALAEAIIDAASGHA